MKLRPNSLLKVAAAIVSFGLTAYPQETISARPGAVNYIEGKVYFDDAPVESKQVGHLTMEANQIVRTDANGKAEILLTPGVFLRLNGDSEVRMVTPSLIDTRVELQKGEAMVSVVELFKENNVSILDNGVPVKLQKKGLYRFSADEPKLSVFDGKATVYRDDKSVDLKKGREIALVKGPVKATKFDVKKAKEGDELYAWSNVRSEYSARTSYSSSRALAISGYRAGAMANGWYWNPFYSSWSFIPSAGYFADPFGFGFYSPGYLYGAPGFYTPIRPGFGWRPIHPNPGGGRPPTGGGPVVRPPVSRPPSAGRPMGGTRPSMGRPAGGGARPSPGRR